MAQITVGLSNGKTSFWDPNTKAYITLSEPVQKVTFDENREDIAEHLTRICHACFASSPTLKLYEGKIPEVAIEAWKAKFDLSGLNIAKNRADKLQAASADVVTAASVKKAEEVEVKAASTNKEVAEEVATKEVAEEKVAEEKVAEKKPAAKAPAKKKAEK